MMKLKRIYLDFNVMIDIFNEESKELEESLHKLQEKKYILVYSPAHMEELAISEKRYSQNEERIQEDLEKISKLTQKNILLPHHGEAHYKIGVYHKYENPIICYKRVVTDFYNINNRVEKVSEEFITNNKENNHYGNNPKEINNILPQDIISEILDKKHFRDKGLFIRNYNNKIEIWKMESSKETGIDIKVNPLKKYNFSFNDFKKNYIQISTIIELLTNLLESSGYHAESIKRSRSRLHDVTHIIYASYTDIFITNDKKLQKKAKAIYAYLKIPTSVMSSKDFLDKYKK